MPFYKITQKGVPGARLVEADKPQQALSHIIADAFDVKKVDGRELLDTAKDYPIEIAGKPQSEPEPEAKADDDDASAGDNPGLSDHREESDADENTEALR